MKFRSALLIFLLASTSAEAARFGEGIAGLRLYSCPSILSRADSNASLSESAVKKMGVNILELSRRSGYSYSGESFGNSQIWSAMAEGWMKPFAKNGDALDTLRRILAAEYPNVEALESTLSLWTEAAGIGRTITPNELVELTWKSRREIPPNRGRVNLEGVIAPNGFIDKTTYARFGRHGFIGADPHDYVGHLIAFADPKFTKTFRRYMDTIDSVLVGNTTAALPKEVVEARATIAELLGGITRDLTHENWTFLEKTSEGKTSLMVAGGWPFNMMMNLKKGRSEDAAKYLLGLTSFSSYGNPYTGMKNLLAKLPGIDAFRSKGHLGYLALKLENSAFTLGASSVEEYKLILAEVTRVFDQVRSTLGRHIDFTNPETIADIMVRFGTEIEKSPRLKRVFRRESRQDFFDAAVEFSEKYLEWAARNLEGFPIVPARADPLAKSEAYVKWTKSFSAAEKKRLLVVFNEARLDESEFIFQMERAIALLPPGSNLNDFTNIDPVAAKYALHMASRAEGENSKMLVAKLIETLVKKDPQGLFIEKFIVRIDDFEAAIYAYANVEKMSALGFTVREKMPLIEFVIDELPKNPEAAEKITRFDQLSY